MREWVRAHPRIVALVGAATIAGSFVAFGGLHWVRNNGKVEELPTETGVVGPLVFIGIMWATQPFGVPGVVYMVPAGLIWPRDPERRGATS